MTTSRRTRRRPHLTKWYRSFRKIAKSLSFLPLRYELIPEIEEFDLPYRHVIFDNFRIIYPVEENRVTIHRVIRAARLLGPSDLPKA